MSIYDEHGNITRDGAEQVIRGGGSVIINKRLYSSVDKLPDVADFAVGNPSAQADARTRLEKQIADSQAQLARLGPAGSGGGVTEVGGAKSTEDSGPNAPSPRRSGKS